MAKFKKKPVVIEAVQWNGSNSQEIANFFGEVMYGEWANTIPIVTLKGTMEASLGDWIIKGVNGEFYPCKPEIFEKTYEAVELPTLAAVKIFDVAEEMAPTSGLSITYTRVCDNCGDDSGEAVPLHGEYGNGKHYNYLCVDCFNLLGLTFGNE